MHEYGASWKWVSFLQHVPTCAPLNSTKLDRKSESFTTRSVTALAVKIACVIFDKLVRFRLFLKIVWFILSCHLQVLYLIFRPYRIRDTTHK